MFKSNLKPTPEPSNSFETDATYFTTRKIKGGWIAESISFEAGNLVRQQLTEPGSRSHAIETFKISVVRYWQQQYKTI